MKYEPKNVLVGYLLRCIRIPTYYVNRYRNTRITGNPAIG